jgi:hypothetical protein
MLKQWPNAAIQFVPIVNQLGKDGRESYTRSISEVSQFSDSLSKISIALDMAEGARIEKGVGDGSIGILKSKDFIDKDYMKYKHVYIISYIIYRSKTQRI